MDEFLSSSSESWEMRSNLTERSLFTMPVRRYLNGGAEYTVLACIDYNNPHQVFYNLEIRAQEGLELPPPSPQRDFQIVHELLEEFPSCMSHYGHCERRLEYKLAQLVEEWKHERQSLRDEVHHSNQKNITNKYIDREAEAIVESVKLEILERRAVKEIVEKLNNDLSHVQLNTIDEYIDEDDDNCDGLFGSVLGVFARSD